jgi:hypothetical protein
MLMKGTVVKRQRRRYRDFILHELEEKLMFFEDLLGGPALRTIELHHIAATIFVLKLVNRFS